MKTLDEFVLNEMEKRDAEIESLKKELIELKAENKTLGGGSKTKGTDENEIIASPYVYYSVRNAYESDIKDLVNKNKIKIKKLRESLNDENILKKIGEISFEHYYTIDKLAQVYTHNYSHELNYRGERVAITLYYSSSRLQVNSVVINNEDYFDKYEEAYNLVLNKLKETIIRFLKNYDEEQEKIKAEKEKELEKVEKSENDLDNN